LRERGEDVLLLIDHFLGIYAEENNFERPRLSSEAFTILKNYSWQGNIRELRNFCENLVVLKRGDEITPYDLDPRFSMQADDQDLNEQSTAHTLSVEENEKRLLRNALVRAMGNRTKAAELMGISRRTLHRKLARWPELDTQ
jgi:DNA-binding NtrC family response regulator